MSRLLLVIPVVFAAGCDIATEGRVEDLSKRINRVEASLKDQDEERKSLVTKVDGLSSSVKELGIGVAEYRFERLLEEIEEKAMWEGLEDGSFRRVRTQLGDILVSIQDVQPYATGTRLKMNFGNPAFATLNNVKATIKYGQKFEFDRDSKVDYDAARKAWEATTLAHNTELKQLLPGSWNEQTVTLPSKKPEDISYLEVTLEVKSLSLRRE